MSAFFVGLSFGCAVFCARGAADALDAGDRLGVWLFVALAAANAGLTLRWAWRLGVAL